MADSVCQAKKKVNYAESGNEDSDEENQAPATKSRRRLMKRRKTEDSEDDYLGEQNAEDADDIDEGMYHRPEGLSVGCKY